MRAKSIIQFSIPMVVVVIIGLLGWLVWTDNIVGAFLNSDSPEAQGIVPVYLESLADGRIQFGYGIELPTRSAAAMVEYDYQTIAGINEYVALNQSHLERLLEAAGEEDALAVRVTFNQPLSQEEFTAFVEQYRLTVNSYVIWIENDDGTTTTIQGGPSDTELIPAERFNYVLTDVQSRGGLESPGWVEVDGTVVVTELKFLSGDTRVFLVDIMAAVIQQQFTDSVMKQAGISRTVRSSVLEEGLQVNRPTYLAWAIRNQGLMGDVPTQ